LLPGGITVPPSLQGKNIFGPIPPACWLEHWDSNPASIKNLNATETSANPSLFVEAVYSSEDEED